MPGIREEFRMSMRWEIEGKAALNRAEGMRSREQVKGLALEITLAT